MLTAQEKSLGSVGPFFLKISPTKSQFEAAFKTHKTTKNKSFGATSIFYLDQVSLFVLEMFSSKGSTDAWIHYNWICKFSTMFAILHYRKKWSKIGEAESFSTSDLSWMASGSIPASSSSLFSCVCAKTYKASETFVDKVDNCVVFLHIVCEVLWLFCYHKNSMIKQ